MRTSTNAKRKHAPHAKRKHATPRRKPVGRINMDTYRAWAESDEPTQPFGPSIASAETAAAQGSQGAQRVLDRGRGGAAAGAAALARAPRKSGVHALNLSGAPGSAPPPPEPNAGQDEDSQEARVGSAG